MKSLFISLLLPLFFLSSCRDSASTALFAHEETNAIYYWRTDFRLDSLERDFIAENDIGRLYIRFFDVVAGDDYGDNAILPNATITFTDTIPQSVSHVVPTVYITIDALHSIKGHEADAASKIVRRVLNMLSFNEIPNVDEFQLDCDWTESTGPSYFNLCRAVRDSLDWLAPTHFALSSTIRLHQLRQPAPPVDYGVLMCYNTGSFRNPDCQNSILDFNDVEPYFRSNISYPIHLDLALPIYDWTLSYRDNKFAGISRSKSPSADATRHEKSDFNTIMRVTSLIYSSLSPKPGSNILYHLDSKNLLNFSDDEIYKIYSCGNL